MVISLKWKSEFLSVPLPPTQLTQRQGIWGLQLLDMISEFVPSCLFVCLFLLLIPVSVLSCECCM